MKKIIIIRNAGIDPLKDVLGDDFFEAFAKKCKGVNAKESNGLADGFDRLGNGLEDLKDALDELFKQSKEEKKPAANKEVSKNDKDLLLTRDCCKKITLEGIRDFYLRDNNGINLSLVEPQIKNFDPTVYYNFWLWLVAKFLDRQYEGHIKDSVIAYKLSGNERKPLAVNIPVEYKTVPLFRTYFDINKAKELTQGLFNQIKDYK